MIISSCRQAGTARPAGAARPAGTAAQASTAAQAGTAGYRHRRLALLLGATAVLSTACSSATSSSAPAASTPPAASTATSSASSASSVVVSTSPSQATVASSSLPATPSTSPVTASRPAPSTTVAGCQATALTVQALRGSGAAGHQYAFLQFTNKSAKSCSLTGFPGVQLLRGGALLGKPATRAKKPTTTILLAPGRSATARLVDDSTCNAEKSDSVQIYPPNLTHKFVAPLSIRGCALTIDPVVAS